MQKALNILHCFAACPPRRIGRSADRPALRLSEKKKLKVAQRRQAAKASGSHTEQTIISLRLPTAGRSIRLCEKKKEKKQLAK
jgi:hypothetical protein